MLGCSVNLQERESAMLTARQLRAARALLGWSAQDLAKRVGMNPDSVLRLETEKVSIEKARVGTINKLTKALEDGGVELLDRDGVRMRQQGEGASR